VYDDDCHSIPLANQIQRIFERTLTSKVVPGDILRGQAFVHVADVVEAFVKTVDARHQLAPEEVFLIGEPDTLSYDHLQRAFGRLIHGEEWDTQSIPKALAKAGAWLEDRVPGEEPFIKPWMIDLADDHYVLDIGRARRTLGWEPKESLRETLPRRVSALKADPQCFYKANKLEAPSWLKPSVAPREMTQTSGERTESGRERGHAGPGQEHGQGHLQMLRDMRAPWLWPNATVILLGLWLIGGLCDRTGVQTMTDRRSRVVVVDGEVSRRRARRCARGRCHRRVGDASALCSHLS
jgi:hypothetical protein